MASWLEFQSYVRANYKVREPDADTMQLLFGLPGDRSQLVYLFRHRLLDGMEEWVSIESPVGDLASVDLRRALDIVGGFVAGGLSVVGSVVTLKHSMPIANLDANEFDRPLRLVVSSADDMERQLVGGDRF